MAPRFVPRQRKHRIIAREKEEKRQSAKDDAIEHAASLKHEAKLEDSNATEILPGLRNESEARKRNMREELRAAQPKMSSKKQKRLDKYIDTKLRKDDTLALIKRLEGRQRSLDTSLFQSTKTLGQRTETRREALRRALELKRRGLGGKEEDQILFERPHLKRGGDWGEDEDEDEDEDENGNVEDLTQQAPIQALAGEPTTTNGPGSGLKVPLEVDKDGKPIISSRKRRKVAVKFDLLPNVAQEWEGLSDDTKSEASSNAEERDDEEDEETSHSSDSEIASGDHKETSEEESSGSSSGSEESDSEGEESQSDTSKAQTKSRTSAFKAWAEQQRNEAIGFTPSTIIGTVPVQSQVSDAVKGSFTVRPLEEDPLPEGFLVKSYTGRKVHAVSVERSDNLQTARLELPILAEEQRIMEAIFNNDVVVVSGATGSGKTTQVPQFLYENGFGDPKGPTPGMIGVTQPRRVAAVSMAKRVADELGNAGNRVAHQIRFDTTVGKQTAVKFMTDGVLLREMSEDFSLRKYSAIVIDEAHERTVNTDILISLMSRCIKIRRKLAEENPDAYTSLKLIIMSATLRVSDFRENSRLFSDPPPLVEAEGRQYEVTPHWSRKTSHDYVEEAFKKVSRGHRKLPPGGILVFLTGQNEIRTLAQRLKQTFRSTDHSGANHPQLHVSASEMPVEAEDLDVWEAQDQTADCDEVQSDDGSESEDLDAEFVIEGEEAEEELMNVHVLPLYSQLPSKEQLKVFMPPPEGSRLIILATNIAETSLTIPGIRYVFDSGRHKERTWDRAGVQTFRTAWISKASADQRMGRAGRTGPGHCYRLYSSAIYESAMPQFAEPEIYRTPLEGVVLQLKAMNISRIDNFPFPTPPDRSSLVKAESLLKHLGALDSKGKITKLGRDLQNYPLSPRFAQMLRLGVIYDCIPLAIAIVAALDVPEILIPDNQLDLRTPARDEETVWTEADSQVETLRQQRRQAFNTAQAQLSRLDFNSSKVTAQSDALKLFAAIYDFSNAATDEEAFCRDNFLREKGVRDANQLREQLTTIVRSLNPARATGPYQAKLPKPSSKQVALLKQIVAAGFIDQVAIRADLLPTPPIEQRKPKRAIDIKYKTLLSSNDMSKGRDLEQSAEESDPFVYIHPGSILARLPANQVPRYIVYQRLQRSQPSAPGKKARVRMHPLTPASAEQLSVLARGTSLLDIGKPLGKIGVLESVGGHERRECEVMLSLIGEGGGVGWPLARKRVIQNRIPMEGWIVDKWVD